jgi:hypothetical protein
MTTVTLRPTLPASLSDNSDATYITVSPSFGVADAFGTFVLGTGVTKTLTMQARARSVADDKLLGQFSTASGLVTGLLHSTNDAMSAVSGAPIPVTMTQAEIDSLGWALQGVAGYGNVDVAELYAVVVYVVQPVVALDPVTPDPFTASTIVPVSWVDTLDAAGGAQTRYQVVVIAESEFPLGSTVEAAPHVYDSGAVLSSATTHTAGPLAVGEYRVAVRVAQTVNGAAHWSDWDLDAFEVDVATTDVAAVTTIANWASASVAVMVARDVPSEAWDLIEVQRSLDAGVTWSDVRGATYMDATVDADQFIVIDHEVPNDVRVRHRARATRIVGGLPITGDWVASTSTSWSSTDTWLKVPNEPSLNTVVKLQRLPRLSRPRRTGVHRPLRRAKPVVVTDVRGAYEGVVVFWFRTDAEADALDAALESPVVLLVGPPEWHRWGSRYLAVSNETDGGDDEDAVLGDRSQRGIKAVQVYEVDAPADPDAGR